MDRFARVVLGYHGNSDEFVAGILEGRRKISEWPLSENAYDWLGRGIYFWEHAPMRALRWAEEAIARRPERYAAGAKPAVIGAVIQVSPCFDLTDIASTQLLAEAYLDLEATYQDQASRCRSIVASSCAFVTAIAS